jgi:hypothetical protein
VSTSGAHGALACAESLRQASSFASRLPSWKNEALSSLSSAAFLIVMPPWIQQHGSPYQAQLVTTAVLSGIAVAGLILGVQAIQRSTGGDGRKV